MIFKRICLCVSWCRPGHQCGSCQCALLPNRTVRLPVCRIAAPEATLRRRWWRRWLSLQRRHGEGCVLLPRGRLVRPRCTFSAPGSAVSAERGPERGPASVGTVIVMQCFFAPYMHALCLTWTRTLDLGIPVVTVALKKICHILISKLQERSLESYNKI